MNCYKCGREIFGGLLVKLSKTDQDPKLFCLECVDEAVRDSIRKRS